MRTLLIIGMYCICTLTAMGQDLQTEISKHSQIIAHLFDNNTFEVEPSYDELFELIGNSTISVTGRKARTARMDIFYGKNETALNQLFKEQLQLLLSKNIISEAAFEFLNDANNQLKSAADPNVNFKQNMNQINLLVRDLITDANKKFNVQSIEGELIFGYLYLADDSATFWGNGSSDSGYSARARGWIKKAWSKFKVFAGRTLPQVDALGYIVGWGTAAYNDYQNGTLEAEGQWDRIGEGISAGANASAFQFMGG
jgi:hypothetical protein